MKDIAYEVRRIISHHTAGMMMVCRYHPESNEKLYEHMAEECSRILTEGLLDGTYTPMEYNDIRNALANALWDIFAKYIENNIVVTIGKLTKSK